MSSPAGGSGRKGRKKGSAKKSEGIIDLTHFGFKLSSAKKKRPAPVATAPGGSDAEAADGGSAKRARAPGSAAAGAVASRGGNSTNSGKVGSGKENPLSAAKKPPSSAAAISATPVTSEGKAGENAGGSGRAALLDLTGDSSENRAGSKTPAKPAAPAKAPAAAMAGATKTLGGMGGELADMIAAASKSTNHNAAQPKQRRGKRDRQPGSAAKPEGAAKHNGATEAPISIFEDGATEPPAKAPRTDAKTASRKGGGGSTKSPTKPKFAKGAVVDVQSRTWPGINEPGGVARICHVHPAAEGEEGAARYDVTYVLDNRREKKVEERWISAHEEYGPEKKRGETKMNEKGKAARKEKGNAGRKSPPEQKARSKSPAKKTGPAREGSIQSYFSAGSVSPPGKVAVKMGNSPGRKKPSPNGKGKAGPKALGRTKSPKKRSPKKDVKFDALALVPVPDHSPVHCSTAVANAHKRLFDPSTNEYVDVADYRAGKGPYRIELDSILGRPSSGSKKTPKFVDIDIPKSAPGISRKHVRVTEIEGLSEGEPRVQFQALHEQGLELVFKPRLQSKRKPVELNKGQAKSITVGDAIGFKTQDEKTNEKMMYYCVVGLVFAPNAKAGMEDVKEVIDVDAARPAAKTLDFTTPYHEGSKKPMPKTSATRPLRDTIEIDDDEDEDGRKALPKKALADDSNFTPSKMPGDEKMEAPAAKAMFSSRTTQIPTELPSVDADVAMKVAEKTKPDEGASGNNLAVAPKVAAQEAAKDVSQTQSLGDDSSAASKEAPIETIKKGDCVKVLFDEDPDMFGDTTTGWYLGTTMTVKSPSGGSSKNEISVGFDDGSSDTFAWPSAEVEKVADLSSFYPSAFHSGDVVDALFQNGCQKGRWYRGRIAEVRNEQCDILYYDKEFESNVPTNEKKVRLIRRDTAGEQSWVIGKDVTVHCAGGDGFRTGVISAEPSSDCYRIAFSDRTGGEMEMSYEEAAAAVLTNVRLEEVPLAKQHVWPVSSTESMAETVRRRRQRTKAQAPVKEKTERKAEPKPAGRGRKPVAVKEEPTDANALDEDASLDELDNDMSGGERLLLLPIQGGPAVDPELLASRKVAKDFPPGLPNVLWCALNSPEPRTGYNFLRELLTVHDSVPPTNLVSKLMELMKYGPRAEGSSTVHFKDPNRTELASAYVYSLVKAQKRFVRRGDSPAIFGPSTWDDIEVLLSQSIAQTENAISGRRLAHALQLAARGARLMELMLKSELQGHDLYVTPDAGSLDTESLQGMSTVRLMKTYGARSALKATVGHATRCLVRHSRWILGQDRDPKDFTRRHPNDDSSAMEARACLESLGSVVCTVSWMLCAEEGIDISTNPTECAFVIKDEFLLRMESSLDELPDMTKRARDKFVKRLKLYFLLSLREEFAEQLVPTLAKMIGVEWR